MAFLIEGRLFGLLCLAAIMAAVAYYIKRAEGGTSPKLRRIPGIDAIDEAIGRAVEMGRPVFCSHGIANLRGATSGPQTLAGLSVLSYVAKRSVDVGAELIVPVRVPEVWPIAAEIVETEYKLAGKADEFNSDSIVFLSPNQFGYAMQIAGTANTSQIPFFLVATDYCLIGEEIYSAGAYLTNDAPLMASLAGQDVGRIIAVLLGLLGAITVTMGSTILLDLFAM